MSFLSETEVENLTIERMIFHVVDPASESPTFLAEVKPPQCVDFFVERVKETLRGAAYEFLPGAGVPELLYRALPTSDGDDDFIQVSHDLADRFKDKVKQDKRLAPGVLMLFALKTTGNVQLVAVIKYEHQQVVSYSYIKDESGTPVLDADGNPVPDLQTLVETFTKDRKAMQKSAVIRFQDYRKSTKHKTPQSSVVVIDHSSGRYRDATQHFANFLDIKRTFEPIELTKRLEDAAVESIKANKHEVPAEVAKAPKRFVRTAISRLDGFDFEKPEEFLSTVLQGVSPEAKILKTFKSKLANKNISTEAFKFEGATPPAAEYRRVVTNEGITLLFSAGHEENKNVKIKDEDNGGVEITIRSTGLERNDELEKMPRIPD
ncbi:nucleoid-associated protein [Alloalcanivorax mobilis]|uniref:nucleoid-associated protein n=1 Tax=Alloalcanivorax mobilis TaxID=2019569 RepID=UPI000C78DFE1|nr:nucleoid-associated protein [Alloalcanivorax mobilis]